MPAKGSKLVHADRNYIFTKDFHKSLVEEKGLKLDYKQAKEVSLTANSNVAEVILEEIDGFKMPHGLGYLCITKFVPKTPAINWNATKKNDGKHVYFSNLGTFGWSIAIKWFMVGRITGTRFFEVYKFSAMKKLAVAASARFRSGKTYSEYSTADFIEKSRLENLYNKKYRKGTNEI